MSKPKDPPGQLGDSMVGISFMLGGPPATGVGVGALKTGGVQPSSSTFLPVTARPYIAHLSDYAGTFKAELGILLTRPAIRATVNAGYQPLTLELPATNATLLTGDIVTITEQGGDGSTIYEGVVDAVADIVGSKTSHLVTINPYVVELGRTPFNHNYETATDIGQMVYDAVATTQHLAVTPLSNNLVTGITAVYNFNNTSALDVLNQCRKIAGVNFRWFVDHQGVVWFGAIGSGPILRAQRGQDYSERTETQDASGLANTILVVGGVPSGASAPITATYSGAGSLARYGVRRLLATPTYPNVLDQATLDDIAATLGAIYDRVSSQVQVTLDKYSKGKVVLSQPGGALMQTWEPTLDPFKESDSGADAGVSATFPVLDVQLAGVKQTVSLADAPFSGSVDDLQYEIDRIVERDSLNALAAVPAVINPDGGLGGGLQSASAGARWFLNQTELGVSDGVRNRIEIGNLGSYTDPQGVASPAGWQIRNVGSDGGLIFDSLGLATPLQVVPIANPNPSPGPFNGTNSLYQAIPGSASTFIATRKTSYLAMASFAQSWVTTNATGAFVSIDIFQGSPNTGTLFLSGAGLAQGNTIVSAGTMFLPFTVPTAGTYSIQLDSSFVTWPAGVNNILFQQITIVLLQIGG